MSILLLQRYTEKVEQILNVGSKDILPLTTVHYMKYKCSVVQMMVLLLYFQDDEMEGPTVCVTLL